MRSTPSRAGGRGRCPTFPTLTCAAVLLATQSAQAFQIDTGVPGLRATWDSTFKYSNALRVKSPSPAIVGGVNYDPASGPAYFPNTDDGDNNFGRGLISNRLDVFTEFDLVYRDFGLRLSGAGWYDSVYNSSNDNNSPSTVNHYSRAFDQFPEATRNLHGRKAELLDAFVFGKVKLGGRELSARLGKHTILYGESLFFGANGIAAAQAPVDVVKALSVPNAQFKEFMMPINQLSTQLEISPDVAIGAYYQLDWKPDRLPGVGSYFSFLDFIGAGQERLIVGSTPFGPAAFYTEPDRKPKSSGQGGLQLRFHAGESDFGLYAVRWNARSPSAQYLHPFATPAPAPGGVQLGTYQWVYHQGIQAYGASASTTFGATNVAVEVSLRKNTPLDSDGQLDVLRTGDNSGKPLYAVGKSAHAQVSWLATLGDSFISREADFLGEIAWNRLLSITKNPGALTPDTTRDAVNLRMVYEPRYRQVIDGVDLSVPIGLGVGLHGNSAVVGAFSARRTGDMSIGLSGSYLDVWRFGLNYTHYFGKAGPFVTLGHHVFNQSYADRDFVSFNVRRSF
jgi:hypothetical protein